MIEDIDEALRALIRRDAVNGTDVEVVFDAPTKDWSARRNAPTVDVYLYDIREDLKWRAYGSADVYDTNGRITARHGPPRHFKLSYLITAWTQRPEDEHRLLSAVLGCFLRFDALPVDLLPDAIARVAPVRTTIAIPPPEDRALSDTWSALGGELKPSLDLVVTAPMEPREPAGVAALIQEQPRFTFEGPEQQEKTTGRARPEGHNGGPAGTRPRRGLGQK